MEDCLWKVKNKAVNTIETRINAEIAAKVALVPSRKFKNKFSNFIFTCLGFPSQR